MRELFGTISMSDYEDRMFDGDYTCVYILYCVAIAENKLLSVADGTIIAVNGIKLRLAGNYLLKARIVMLGKVNLFVLNNNTSILVGCSNELRQVTVSKSSITNLFKINEFDCSFIDCSTEHNEYNFLTNIIVPVELEVLCRNGVFVYSYQYDEYLNML